MNIIELAREAAASKGHTLKDVPEQATVEFLEAFSVLHRKTVIAELIEGVGEPALSRRKDREYFGTYKYREGNSDPMFWEQFYTPAQVAGVVAKAKEPLEKNALAYREVALEQKQRIAELESERDMWKATAEATVDFEKSQMRKRIESLEAARMAYAREFALNADGEPDVGNIHTNIRAMKDALKWLDRWMGHKPLAECAKKIKEVIHAES